MVCAAVSITGVERMPSGSTLPQPTCAGTFDIAAPTCRDHNTPPSLASSAYTVLFSVAVKTRPLNTSGCAYTAGVERRGCQAWCAGSSCGSVVSLPVRCALPLTTARSGRPGQARQSRREPMRARRRKQVGTAATHSGKSAVLGGTSNVMPRVTVNRQLRAPR